MPSSYAHPEVLVSCRWLAARLNSPRLRIVEVSSQTKTYWQGHIPGAISWSWQTQLSSPRARDIPSTTEMEWLLSQSGIHPETTIILYGDCHNWFATWAFWILKLHGHRDVRLLNGGRRHWATLGLPLVLDEPSPLETIYFAPEPNRRLRALYDDVRNALSPGGAQLLDVRSSAEYNGEISAPHGALEPPLRAGHIPGAQHFFWGRTTRANGLFHSPQQLRRLFDAIPLDYTRPVFTYCRIGKRASHTWFVLRYLLGHPDVRNYDGSWMEWANLIGAPIAR